MDELITKVEQWAKDKGLDQAQSSKQMLKTVEEVGEVAAALARKDEHGLRDGIGDVVVTLIILAMQNDMDLYECLNQAYNEIKGRTGKMVDGVFVKSSDLKQLDESQKPVVPKFVADYIEEYRGGGATLYEMMDSSEDEVYTWLFGNPRIETENERQLLFAQAYAVGYEVEKEPLYEVIIGDLYLIKKFNNRNDFYFDTSCSLCAWEKSAYQLTESEIKAIDERYWPFAVPVEEVGEG